MKRQDAERIICDHVKPIFGFALKRCKTYEDAEDLSGEIVLRAFRALLKRDGIADPSKFIWTVAHHTLCNYYRDHARYAVGIPLDEVAEFVSDPEAAADGREDAEETRAAIHRLQSEIAYLSKLQRKIVIAYYFENRKQAEIADRLGIPLGTVKWHLFEAKKELKRGIDTVRKTSELKFNPIRLRYIGINGTPGKRSLDEIFRSALAQNVCYCVRNTAKTVNEIADALGVSPVYVEAEAERLEEYGLLRPEKDKYLLNFLIYEPTAELLVMKDNMYKRAAELFANDLYDELISSGILDDEGIICNQTDEPISLTSASPRDSFVFCNDVKEPSPVKIRNNNFILWSLIPYIAARSGEGLMEECISFEEVATMRPDGGYNIVHATVMEDDMVLPWDYVHMNNWCGPMWDESGGEIFWQVDSQWSDRPSPSERSLSQEAENVIAFYRLEEERALSRRDYAWLAERGYIKTCGDPDDRFRASLQIVALESKDIHDRLLAIGEKIKRKYKSEFDAIKAPYVKAVLDSVPAHLRKLEEYELQFIFHSDGWFLLHCIVCLLKNGKLWEPTEGQRKALTTLIVPRV